MTVIYCDESGNSGQDLLDPTQPHFVLASNNYETNDARELLALVATPQATEAKFRALKKSAPGRRKLVKFFTDPRVNSTRIIGHFLDKRYMVYTKLVDLIAEEILHAFGQDLYQRGGNLAMANMLYYCTPTFCGRQAADDFLRAFVRLLRDRTDDARDAFYAAGDRLKAASKDPEFAQSELWPFTKREMFHVWFDGIPENAIDPAIPALFFHIVTWGDRLNHRFKVVHDRSKPVLASEEQFRNMMAGPTDATETIGYDRRKFGFPLRADSLEQGDSHLHPQIQIADLCAGAMAHVLRAISTGISDELAEALLAAGCRDLIVEGVFPTPDVTPAALGTEDTSGVNPVTPVIEHLRRRRSRGMP